MANLQNSYNSNNTIQIPPPSEEYRITFGDDIKKVIINFQGKEYDLTGVLVKRRWERYGYVALWIICAVLLVSVAGLWVLFFL